MWPSVRSFSRLICSSNVSIVMRWMPQQPSLRACSLLVAQKLFGWNAVAKIDSPRLLSHHVLATLATRCDGLTGRLFCGFSALMDEEPLAPAKSTEIVR
jgi:hypothetical protein